MNYNAILQGAAGKKSMATFNSEKSWLKPTEVDLVINYICEMDNQGFLLSHCTLQEHVNEILQACLGDDFPKEGVGKQWSHQFVLKHSNRIKMVWSAPLETKCGCAVNPMTTKAWFNLLCETIEAHEVEEELTYRTDEIGTNPAGGQKEHVMGKWKPGPQYQQRNGNQENIMVIVTVYADGSSTPPAVILKGQAFQVKWKQDNPANAS